MKQIASLAVLLLIGNSQAKKLSFASGMKGDEMLDESITLKTTGPSHTFVPNTKFMQFASGMKGDEMLDEAITLKTSGPS